MDQPAIKVEGLTKYYPLETNKPNACISHLMKSLFRGESKTPEDSTGYFKALEKISFTLPKGSTMGIIGLNGSGKSTLLQILAGTLKPSKGTVETHGKIAAILELGSGFNMDFTGVENIELNSTIHGFSPKELESVKSKIIAYADIGEFVHQPVRTYSSGMLVRLAFSVCIHTDPDILIIDEALAVGDARFQAKCFQSILNLQKQGKTILFVSHDSNSVAQICNEAILLQNGEICAHGDPGSVINDYSKILTGHKLTGNTYYPPQLTSASQGDSNDGEKDLRQVIQDEENLAEGISDAEYTYGGAKGEILSFEILDQKGHQATTLIAGDYYSFEMRANAKSSIEKPIYALKIRSPKRQDIYGTNTLFYGLETSDLAHGDQVLVKFKLKINLIPGVYFISLGFTRIEGEEIEVIQRRYDIQEIHVVGNDGAFGIANCSASISVEEIQV